MVKGESYRKVKSIDFDALCLDLETSELFTREYTNIRDLSLSYNSMHPSLFDNHAPLKTKTVVSRQIVPWFNSDIQTRTKAERKWHASNTQQDFRAFNVARNYDVLRTL